MAISVDRVYQQVLTMANKEQRGYITPQEFNLLANQAQLEIFEQYFYDINQRDKIDGSKPGVKGEEDLSFFLDEKIQPINCDYFFAFNISEKIHSKKLL